MHVTMQYESLHIDHHGAVSQITMNRPPVNAVSVGLLEELLDALDVLEAREDTRCILLTGGGEKAFSAGADLSSGELGDGGSRFHELGRATVNRLETLPKPTVSAIRGWCIGGGFGLALSCDIRLASTTARFRTADAYLGVVPSWGMSLVRLVHFIGRNRTMDMLILGEDLDARSARDLGLVTRVIPDETFHEEVTRLTTRIAGGAPMTFRAIKEAVRAQYWQCSEAAQKVERRWSDLAQESHDLKEGMAAFRERRPPVFKGN